jgi:hypothetical protein
MGKYAEAETAAKAALAVKYGSAADAIADTISANAYQNMWGQITEQTEESFLHQEVE